MSQLPSRRRRDRPQNPNSRHSQIQPSPRHHIDGPSDAASLPDLNLIPQLDFCADVDLFSDFVDPNFHYYDSPLDLDFGSTSHLGLGFCSSSESEEEDVASGLGSRFQFQRDFGPRNLQPEGLRVSAIDSCSDSDDFLHGVDCLSCDAESEGSYFGLGGVDFRLGIGGTDTDSIIDPGVVIEEIVSEVDEIRSMSTGMDSHFSEFEFSSGFSNLEEFATDEDDNYMAFLGILHVQEDGEIDIEQLVENVSVLRGARPAAKNVVDELPVVEMGRLNVGACPICIEEISGGEKVTVLPCKHYYHGDCILPWLGERNTCPVCRYELPTAEEDEESCWIPEPAPAAGGVDEDELDDSLVWW